MVQRPEAQVDSRFEFLDSAGVDLLGDILLRRSPALFERIRHEDMVSRSDADEVMTVLTKELSNNLDDDWEPTEEGLAVSAVLAQFNAARLSEWP